MKLAHVARRRTSGNSSIRKFVNSSIPSSSHVGRQDQQMVVCRERRLWIADELVAVQVGRDRRVQAIGSNEVRERRKPLPKRRQQLPEGLRVDDEIGNADPFAWNA